MVHRITYEYVTGKFGLYTLAETKLRRLITAHPTGLPKDTVDYARQLLIEMIELYEFLLEQRALLDKEVLSQQHLDQLKKQLGKLDPPPGGSLCH